MGWHVWADGRVGAGDVAVSRSQEGQGIAKNCGEYDRSPCASVLHRIEIEDSPRGSLPEVQFLRISF